MNFSDPRLSAFIGGSVYSAAEAFEHFIDGFAGEVFWGEGCVFLAGVGFFVFLFPEVAEDFVGVSGEVELFAEDCFPVGAAEGAADHVVEFGGFVAVEFSDGVEDVVFEDGEHGIFFVAVGDEVVEHAHGCSFVMWGGRGGAGVILE